MVVYGGLWWFDVVARTWANHPESLITLATLCLFSLCSMCREKPSKVIQTLGSDML